MQYRVDGQRIIAFDDQEPLARLVFQKSQIQMITLSLNEFLCNQLTVDKELQLN